jgi:hypothetical protein
MENIDEVIKKLCEAFSPEEVQAALDKVKVVKTDGDPVPPDPTHPPKP